MADPNATFHKTRKAIEKQNPGHDVIYMPAGFSGDHKEHFYVTNDKYYTPSGKKTVGSRVWAPKPVKKSLKQKVASTIRRKR